MKYIFAHYIIVTIRKIHVCHKNALDLDFSIYDSRDNDRSSLNCASMLKGGWWWKSCGRGLNGLYLNDPQDLTARQGTFITCYSKHS